MNPFGFALAAALFLTVSFGGLCAVILGAKYAEKHWINPIVYGCSQ